MSTLEELAQRLQRIEDAEAIKQTMFDYFHRIDLKQWDLLGDCFCEDIHAHYGRETWQVDGREALVAWLRAAEGGDNYSVSHASHNEQVTLHSATEATGFFKLHDWVRMEPGITLRGWGHYTNDFVKEADGRWRIRTINLRFAYKEEYSAYRGDLGPSIIPPDPRDLKDTQR